MKNILITAAVVSALWLTIYFAFPNNKVTAVPYPIPGKAEVIYDTAKPKPVNINIRLKAERDSYKAKYEELAALGFKDKPADEQIKEAAEDSKPGANVFTMAGDSLSADLTWRAKAIFYSPIPIHPDAKFDFKFSYTPPPVVNKTTYITVEKKLPWYNGVGLTIGAGAVYSAKHKDITTGYFTGIAYTYCF